MASTHGNHPDRLPITGLENLSDTPGQEPVVHGHSQPAGRGLRSLSITQFRNIAAASLEFGRGLNLIHGANGSGKTSLLEAIFCLGRVRSFRCHQPEQAIRYGQPAYQLVGRIYDQDDRLIPLGIERFRSSLTVHFNGELVRRLSDLAGNFPVQILSGDTATIFSGGPRFRRQTLDWALFHVEPTYRDVWQRYSRVLRQRNAALRAQATGRLVQVWDEELVDTASAIDRLRSAYLDELTGLLVRELGRLLPEASVSLRYLPGWPASTSLAEALVAGLDKDRLYGSTQYGVHRADYRLSVDGHEVEGHCSRGQQKALLVAFLLAQARLQQARGKAPGAFLLDDLPSELDAATQALVFQALQDLRVQVFVSRIAGESVCGTGWPEIREFHVEHGVIREVL
jgi:DNA replication and repair protein RecF